MGVDDLDRSAIRAVVEAQLRAFQRDDADEAFDFASPGIQDMFRTPANFLRIVQESYLPVYRPRSVIFEDLTVLQQMPTQPVLLLSPEGIPVRALYLMEKHTSGRWLITGCYLVPVETEWV
jgi:ketosteroid isomerase-like protein